MQKICADDRVRVWNRPIRCLDIEHQGQPQIGQAGPFNPRADRLQTVGVGIRRLPFNPAQGAREIDRVLAGAAGDFEDLAAGRKQPFQLRENGVRIAFRRGAVRQVGIAVAVE